MLRILNSSELDGYVLQSPGGPPCELLCGTIASIQHTKEGCWVKIRGTNFEDGIFRVRSATIKFVDRGADRRMLETRIVASKARIGTFISVLVMIQNNERIALDFKHSGLWRLKGFEGEKNVLLGKTYDFAQSKNSVKIKFLDYSRRRSAPYKRYARFSNENLIQAAKESFSVPELHPFAVCICGSEEKEENGEQSYECHAFEILFP